MSKFEVQADYHSPSGEKPHHIMPFAVQMTALIVDNQEVILLEKMLV